MQADLSYEQLDPYNHAFVATVLRLRGVGGIPSLEQFRAALLTLGRYYEDVAAAADRGDPVDMDWIEGKDAVNAGREHAFFYEQFGSVTLPSVEQTHALQRWLGDPTQLLH